MASSKRVLLVGFDPSVVDYSKFPDLTPEKLRAGPEADRARLEELGHRAELCLIDLGATAAAHVTRKL